MLRAAARFGLLLASVSLACAVAAGAEPGLPGGPLPAGVDDVTALLRQEPYDLELLISFGTSKRGSAGHLALAIREPGADDDEVWSANFYADRNPKHERDFITEPLMLRIPKKEYLFGTTSSLGEKASFGLDFGEIYKRSVVGVRVQGLPAAEKRALVAFFERINEDFRRRAKRTAYHDDEVRYDYLRLNCAKTIGSAFRLGAGYRDLEVTSARLLSGRPVVAAVNANLPTEMALKLMKAWDARGYVLDVVMYRKYPHSTWVDPRDEERIPFESLPDRFPSVLSRDFRREQGQYEDVDNLFAMYLLYNLGRHRVQLSRETHGLEIAESKRPTSYPEAVRQASNDAKADGARYAQQRPFSPQGTRVTDDPGR